MQANEEQLIGEFLEGDGAAFEKINQFMGLMTRYDCAIREVRTKFEVLNEELSYKAGRNPIESITSRVKRPVSVVGKLKRLGKPITVESISENLNDVAGIRVICSFIDDIYKVAEMLSVQDDVTVVQVKDYIQKPKPNGYRSYHMIVEIPVFFSEGKQMMRVEIQLRTVAMDFWASLEHQMKYKKRERRPPRDRGGTQKLRRNNCRDGRAHARHPQADRKSRKADGRAGKRIFRHRRHQTVPDPLTAKIYVRVKNF